MIIQWITAKKVKMTVPKGHRRLPKEKRKSGTTLVEMIVTLMLISIMMVMAVASLSSASRIFVRIQKTQYAQSILDHIRYGNDRITWSYQGCNRLCQNI